MMTAESMLSKRPVLKFTVALFFHRSYIIICFRHFLGHFLCSGVPRYSRNMAANEGDNAVLESPRLTFATHCFSLWYYIDEAYSGNLTVGITIQIIIQSNLLTILLYFLGRCINSSME